MEAISPYLPQASGILPYYMLLVSLTSVGNSIQNFKTLHFSRRFYNGLFVRNPAPTTSPDSTAKLLSVPQNSSTKKDNATDQVTPLAARLFGTWTLMVAIVRLYAAYNLHIGPVYDLAIWTYVVAFLHFSGELFVFKSMYFGGPQMMPFLVATTALIWMPMVRSYYVTA